MSCFPPSERIHSRLHNFRRRKQVDEVEIDGTWDFKWRTGDTIRVAFQTPPAGDPAKKIFADLIDDIVKIAARWKTGIKVDSRSSRAGTVPLTLNFLTRETLPALPPDRSKWPKLRLGQAVHYDVLVSLATLPFKIPPGARRPGKKRPAATRQAAQRVVMPRSELGRYARRLEYGIPTVFLGAFRRGQTLKLLAQDPVWRREWEHIVLHEIGHVLGLPHPHQQHDASVQWKSNRELKAMVPGILGLKLTKTQLDHFIELQIKARLPSPEVVKSDGQRVPGPSFSDYWKDPGALSAMNPPFVSAMVKEGPFYRPGAQELVLRSTTGSPDNPLLGPWLVEPTEADTLQLGSMYPRPAEAVKPAAARRPAAGPRPTPSAPPAL